MVPECFCWNKDSIKYGNFFDIGNRKDNKSEESYSLKGILVLDSPAK
jgi:hypothetical protein